MNTTGCPPNYATDQLMLYGQDLKLGSCEVYLPLYIGLFASLASLRVLVSILLFKQWSDREKLRRELHKDKHKKKHRFPLVPSILAIGALLLILFSILSSMNFINSSNNGALALLCLINIPSLVFGYLASSRVLKFGKKIIPFSRKTTKEVRDQIFKLDSLERTDYFLKIVFSVAYLIL